MRIAFFLNEFPALSQPFILNQITGMLDRGHDVQIFATRHSNQGKIHTTIHQYGLLEKTVFLPSPSRRPALSWARALALSVRNGSWRHWRHWRQARQAFALTQGQDAFRLLFAALSVAEFPPFDIVHCQFSSLGPLAIKLRRLGVLSGNLIVSVRGFDITKNMPDRQHDYHEVFRETDIFLPVSVSLQQRLTALNCPAEKIRILHSGIDCEKFVYAQKSLIENEPVKILSIARLVEKKGVEYALRAVAKVAEKQPNIRYRVVGDGPLRDKLEGLIKELGISVQAQIIGWANHEEVIRLLTDSHLLMAPSVTASDGDEEGIPNAVKEAMAMGLPVLSTRHSGIPELVEDGVSGVLVPERDVAALAQGLNQLIERADLWPAMGKAGRARVLDEYEIKALNLELERIYEECALRTPRAGAE